LAPSFADAHRLRDRVGDVKNTTDAKVAVFTCALDVQQTETKGTVLLKSAGELLNFSKGEEKQLEKQFQDIADTGVKVIVTGSGIGDLAMHFLNRMGILVVKVLSKFDLRRLCRVIGATPMTRLVSQRWQQDCFSAGMVELTLDYFLQI
jgi:T-complex protein 1 subunit theta